MKNKMRNQFQDNLINHLIDDYGYPKNSIRKEVIISKDKSRYKADFVIYKEGRPYIIIDEKNYSAKPEDLVQIKHKIEMSGSEFAIISYNFGRSMYFYKIDRSFPGGILKEIPILPHFDDDLTNIDTFEKNRAVTAQNIEKIIEIELWKFFEKRRNEGEGVSLDLLTDVIKIIAAKVYDEEHQNNNSDSDFRANINDDSETIKTNIEMLLLNLEKEISISSKLLISNEEVKNFVLSLQRYNLIQSGIKENVLPRILSQFFKHFGNTELIKNGIFRGLDPIDEYSIGNFLMNLIEVQEDNRILDPACGMGNLLVSVARGEIYGIEILHSRAELTKINLYLAGIRNTTIHSGDIFHMDTEDYLDIKKRGKFNIIITNPPMGKRFMISPNDLSNQEIEKYAFRKSGKSYKENELFYLEKCLDLITNNGQIAILLSNQILSGTSYKAFREYIVKNYKINALVSLSEINKIPLFQHLSILFLTNEKVEDYMNHQIFFAIVKKNINDENWLAKELSQIAQQYNIFSSKDIEQKFTKNIIISKLNNDYRFDYTYYKGLQESIIDDKYQVQSLTNLAEIQIGAKILNNKESTNNEAYIIKGQNIKEYTLIPNYDNKIKIDLELNYKHLINHEDIVMTRSGNPENIGIFLLNHNNKYIASDNVILIRPKKEKIFPYYLLCYLISKNGQKDLETRIKGNTIRSISVQSLSNLKIPLPPKHIQESIGNKFIRYLTLKESKRDLEEQLLQTKKTIDSDISNFYKNGGNKSD